MPPTPLESPEIYSLAWQGLLYATLSRFQCIYVQGTSPAKYYSQLPYSPDKNNSYECNIDGRHHSML